MKMNKEKTHRFPNTDEPRLVKGIFSSYSGWYGLRSINVRPYGNVEHNCVIYEMNWKDLHKAINGCEVGDDVEVKRRKNGKIYIKKIDKSVKR